MNVTFPVLEVVGDGFFVTDISTLKVPAAPDDGDALSHAAFFVVLQLPFDITVIVIESHIPNDSIAAPEPCVVILSIYE